MIPVAMNIMENLPRKSCNDVIIIICYSLQASLALMKPFVFFLSDQSFLPLEVVTLIPKDSGMKALRLY